MNTSEPQNIRDAFRRTANDAASAISSTSNDIRETVSWARQRGRGRAGFLLEPERFRKILITLLKLLIIFELISALLEGTNTGRWGRFGSDMIIAGVLYILWGRITAVVSERKQWARERMERFGQDIGLWDALIFSLLWSDEIMRDIPQDRRRLVVIAYTLLALGIAAAFVTIGSGLMPVVVAGTLVLGGVNLLAWVVSLERGEKEMLRAELALAREVQLALMPKEDPKVEGLDIAGMCVPAREVGGDLYEYVHLGHNGGTFGIAITDVSGKGMQAAMEAVFTSGAFAAEANSGSSTADVLTRLNRVICSRNRKGQFVAFLLVALDPASRTVRFCNAGQTKPLLLSAGVPTWLDGKGVHFPLGMLDNTLYTEREVILAPGDTLFLCTDGITDAMNAGRELFGTERLERLAARLDSGAIGSAGLLSSVTGAVRAHTGDAPQHDDMTLVVVRVL